MATDPGNVRQIYFAAGSVTPTVMADIICRPGDNVDQYVRIGHQGFEQRAFASTDLTEKTQMYGARRLACGKRLEFRLRVADIDANRCSFVQSTFDLVF